MFIRLHIISLPLSLILLLLRCSTICSAVSLFVAVKAFTNKLLLGLLLEGPILRPKLVGGLLALRDLTILDDVGSLKSGLVFSTQ